MVDIAKLLISRHIEFADHFKPATAVNPIARSEIFNLSAIGVNPSTRKSAPLITKINRMSRSPQSKILKGPKEGNKNDGSYPE